MDIRKVIKTKTDKTLTKLVNLGEKNFPQTFQIVIQLVL